MKKINSDDIYLWIIGFSMSVYGLYAIFRQGYNSWRYGYVNLGDYHQFVGLFIAFLGLATLYKLLTRK